MNHGMLIIVDPPLLLLPEAPVGRRYNPRTAVAAKVNYVRIMYVCTYARCAAQRPPTHISLARVGIHQHQHQHQHHGQAMFLAVTPLSLNYRVSVELELQREPWSSHHDANASCKLDPTRSRAFFTTRIVDSVRPEVASKYICT